MKYRDKVTVTNLFGRNSGRLRVEIGIKGNMEERDRFKYNKW